MNKQTMIKYYRKYSASDYYAIGFIYKNMLYVAYMDKIAPRYIKVEYASSKNGGGQKLQLRLNNKHMENLIKKGAECIGSSDLLIGEYNKGVEFERLIYNRNNQTYKGKDNTGFWVKGDININGKEVQVKLNSAQIVMESTLENLKKRSKE